MVQRRKTPYSRLGGAAARPGERPSVSWLVETPDRDSTPVAKADPTDLASVGESDLWLVHGPAARGPPLPQNDIRSTAPGWTRERDGVRVQGAQATVGCARRIPSQQRGPDKFSNLSHEAAAPPRVGERPSVSWLVETPKCKPTFPQRAQRPPRTFPVGELFHSPGLPRQRHPGVPALKRSRSPLGLCWQHPMCNRRTPLDSLARDRPDVAPWQCPRWKSPQNES
jgi:hypothetical protein